jgi:hypothetical protein
MKLLSLVRQMFLKLFFAIAVTLYAGVYGLGWWVLTAKPMWNQIRAIKWGA